MERQPSLVADKIKVFISSVQSEALSRARAAAVAACRSLLPIDPWVFESTAAAPYPPEQVFIPKVSESHVLIWLVEAETSDAVEREILTAIAERRRIFSFLLPVRQRTDRTNRVIEKVREVATTRTIVDEADIEAEVAAALGQDLVRVYLGGPHPIRAALLKRLAAQSRALSIARWEQSGLTVGEATELADDASIGHPVADWPRAEGSLVILIGAAGSGKSLTAARTYRRALERAVESAAAPIPVWLQAGHLASGDIRTAVLTASRDLGDPEVVGATIVVDGATEPGAPPAQRLLLEAHALVRAWPTTSVLITAQPTQSYSAEREVLGVRLLNQDQATALIARISGKPGPDMRYMDQAVGETLRHPLYALLYAQRLRTDASAVPPTRVEMVQWLVERAVPGWPDSADLETLAAAIVSDAAGHLPSALIGMADRAAASGFVRRVGDRLEFGLPILLEWLAAQALRRDHELRRSLLVPDAYDLRDRWRGAVPLALASAAPTEFSDFLGELTRVDAGYAHVVLNDAASRWSVESGMPMRSAMEYAREIQVARGTWLEGLGSLGPLVVPSDRGRPAAIAVAVINNSVVVQTAAPGELEPGAIAELRGDEPWHWTSRVRSVLGGDQPRWAWRSVTRDLERELEEIVKQRSLWVARCVPQRREGAWAAALEVTNGNLLTTRVDLSEFEDAVRKRSQAIVRRRRPIPPAIVEAEIADLRARGETAVREPWPGQDLPFGRFIWSGYSSNRLLERAQAVYEAAIEIYAQLVDNWFHAFARRLRLRALLPARLVAVVVPGVTEDLYRGPGIGYAFLPLRVGATSRVEMQLGRYEDLDGILGTEPFGAIDAAIARERPGRPDLHASYVSSAHLEVYGAMPANELAWSWLAKDLRDLGFGAGGIFPEPV